MARYRFRRKLVTGLLVWIPLGATLFALKILVDLMDRSLLLIPMSYRPETLLGFRLPGLGILLTLALLFLTGTLAANYVGRRMLRFGESLLERIPIVSWIYSGAKKLAETLLSPRAKSFRKVLLIEYPRKDLYSLCFQTSSDVGEIEYRTGRDVVCVFVPTTPNPTSGLILLVPRDDVVELDMSIDEALRMIISLGVVVPEWQRQELLDTRQTTQLPREADPVLTASTGAPLERKE